ncbi:MAG: hypothetical protein RBT72_09170 [Spirochaetia bacterium]|jgi:hypothetical protein|nr:hypothetical protein [Spirochaetia bacterium]
MRPSPSNFQASSATEKRKDNGYILRVGDLRIYVAGDTEPVPEMAEWAK